MSAPTAPTHDGDGFRRVPPSERHPGITELKLPTGRCIVCVGVGPEVEAALCRHASIGGRK